MPGHYTSGEDFLTHEKKRKKKTQDKINKLKEITKQKR